MPLQLYSMETDLGVTDKQYLIALTAFFFPYALLEVRWCIQHFRRLFFTIHITACE
jgi:hypothetical protein